MTKTQFGLMLAMLVTLTNNTGFTAESAATSPNPTALLKAIEDYRFNDFDAALPQLEALHRQFPEDSSSLRYLALAYQESDAHAKAIPLFDAWLKLHHQAKNEDAQFAWVGMASAYLALGQFNNAATSLSSWLESNPDDISSQIMLGDILVRQKAYHDAEKIWSIVLNSPSSKNHQKSAAWYYKAWAAYLQGDATRAQTWASMSLQLDNQGPYAAPAQQIQNAPSNKKLGASALLSLETFYNSNVALLPDILSSTSKEGDSGMQLLLAPSWKAENFDINYVFNLTQHQTRSEYDILMHYIAAAWQYEQWQLTPSIEVVSLAKEKLYQGYGVSVAYQANDLVVQYAAKIKSFSDNYGPTNSNLDRLSGISHVLSANQPFSVDTLNANVGASITSERTNGDANHNDSDSYLQLGINAGFSYAQSELWSIRGDIKAHRRHYAEADLTVLNSPASATKRKDTNIQASLTNQWQPFANKNISLGANVGYQHNISNYSSGTVFNEAIKSYSAWRTGVSVSGKW